MHQIIVQSVTFYGTFITRNMKTLNLLTMGFILSGLILAACEPGGNNSYEAPQHLEVVTERYNNYVQSFSLIVNAKHWRRSSSTDRYVEIALPAITDSILKEGSVIIYLNEAGKNVSLPFTYYQVRRALSFQPSYEKGRAYINILGNFVLSIHSNYTFKIFVVNPKGLKRFKALDWHKYEEAAYALNFNALD